MKEITRSIEHQRKNYFSANKLLPQALHIGAGDILNYVTEDDLGNGQIIKDIYGTVEWLYAIVVANLYPGSPNEKQIMGLEMMKCIQDGLSNNTKNHSNKSQLISNKSIKGTKCTQRARPQSEKGSKMSPHSVTCDDSMIHFFFTDTVTYSLLNLLLSSWDRTRCLACDLILKLLPTPWPGYAEHQHLEVETCIVKPSCNTTMTKTRLNLMEENECDNHAEASLYKQNSEKVLALFQLGCELVGSPRQRNADNGALLLRLLMNVYSLHLRWSLKCSSDGFDGKRESYDSLVKTFAFEAPPSMASKDVIGNDECSLNRCGEENCRTFIDTLSKLLEERLSILLKAFRSIFGQPSSSVGSKSQPISIFSHGVVLALRYCIEDVARVGLLSNEQDNENNETAQFREWTKAIQNVLRLCLQALQTAMLVIAEAAADTYFAPLPNSEKEREYMLVVDSERKIKSLATSTLAGGEELRGYDSDSFMINSNIFMDFDNDGDGVGADGNASNGQHLQHAVVGAWLLVKESCALMSKLVSISLLSKSDNALEEKRRLLSTDDVANVGTAILDALARLKHNGAIAEAQIALQSVCESILQNSSNVMTSDCALSRLPRLWLENLFAKLRGERKASVLRRSAGFAFSFLSLLRSEPKNCPPVLLPVAMDRLFFHAVNGCGVDEKEPNTDSAWRSIVHALNIIRLILLDATLGPDLFPYVTEATKIAVRGFKSDRWAVRNSSMMVFSAVVQRAVDNDKNENGGVRATTPEEFFGRFPSLYPFFITELSDIVERPLLMDREYNWPVAVGESRCKLSTRCNYDENGATTVHPSLYPILLMLSKMKTTSSVSDGCVIAKGSMSISQLSDKFDGSPHAININLFVPLVEECCDQQLYHVREMSAKALASLICLPAVPAKITDIMRGFRDKFCTMYDSKYNSSHAPSHQHPLSTNVLHGMLLQVQELIANARTLLWGSSSEMGNNKNLQGDFSKQLHDQFIPELCNFVDALRVIVLRYGGKSEFLKVDFPPAILLTLSRIFRAINEVLQSRTSKQILQSLCTVCISDILEVSDFHGKVSLARRTEYALDKCHTPMMGLLWKETISDLVENCGEMMISGLVDELVSIQDLQQKNLHKPDFFAFNLFNFSNLPNTVQDAFHSYHILKHFLDFPVSEIREGFLSGCVKVLQKLSNVVRRSDRLQSNRIIIFLFNQIFVCFDDVQSDQTCFSVDEVGLLSQLMRRLLQEPEPPILEATLSLMNEISKAVPFVDVADIMTQEAIMDGIPQILAIIHGTYSPDSLLDIMNPSTRTALSADSHKSAVYKDSNMVTISPTATSALAFSILGWVVGSFFNSAVQLLQSFQNNIDAAALFHSDRSSDRSLETGVLNKLTNNFYFKFNDTEDSLVPQLRLISDDDNSAECDPYTVSECHVPTINGAQVWSWLRLVERCVGASSDCDGGDAAGFEARMVAAQSLKSSGALKWAALQSCLVLKKTSTDVTESQQGDMQVIEKFLRSGGGDFATRLWLVSLRLIQVSFVNGV